MFSLQMGSKMAVVFNGPDCIIEALVEKGHVFSDKPDIIQLKECFYGRGIIATSGPVWKMLRKFCLVTLRKLGFGRLSMEGKISDEVQHTIEYIEDKGCEKEDYAKLFNISTSNIICSIVFGHRFDLDDQNFLKCCQTLSDFFEASSVSGYINFLPFLRYLPGNIGNMDYILQKVKYYEDNLIKPEIERHYRDFDGSTDDFISTYIKEIKDKEKAGEDASMLKEHFSQVISDFYIAGTETTATTISWFLLFLVLNPDIQEKCFKEIQHNVGVDRLPKYEDKAVLPYLQATIAETHRRASIGSVGVMHAASEDTEFRGYIIPKGTCLIYNFDSVLMDPVLWPEPQEFRPGRFLDENGAFVKSEKFIPFSVGPRACPGKSVAEMELFLFCASLIQRFKFLQPDDEPTPSLEPVVGITLKPKPYMVKTVQRIKK